MSLTMADRNGNRRIIKIYHDPITCKEFEGDVWLMKPLDCIGMGDNLEYWEVKFLDGFITERLVNRKHH